MKILRHLEVTLSMGTVIRLLERVNNENIKALGSVNNLYHSLVNFPDNYMSTVEIKYMLLYTRSSSHDHCRKLKLNIDDTEPIKYFVCQTLDCYLHANTGAGGTFVTDATTFLVTCDLWVMPNTAGLRIQLLCAFGITDGSQVEERTLDMHREQVHIFIL
ncbi:hypothetical protein CTI12_AA290200 [Artemisia annua]|uniref:Uncharacterized protein n=1 Tax=Artemisia annua TaxID=35608 RepID=A0A2U1N8P9_ARTAN|nr:hypothetical protein CTI12_AA290200 [Artemisia annua]